AVPRTGRTVWNSPVSQNPTPGIRPAAAFATTTSATSSGGPQAATRRPGVTASPSLEVAPDHAPGVHRDRQPDEPEPDESDNAPAGHPHCDEQEGEDDEIVAEPVAELDPALAEMQE